VSVAVSPGVEVTVTGGPPGVIVPVTVAAAARASLARPSSCASALKGAGPANLRPLPIPVDGNPDTIAATAQ
jgi:hypothetical protein